MRLRASRVGLIVLLASLALLPRVVPPVVVVQATDVLIFVLFAVSLNLLIGYTGMLSLGHAAFFAVGGYGTGLVVKHLGLGMPVALLVGPLADVCFAATNGANISLYSRKSFTWTQPALWSSPARI